MTESNATHKLNAGAEAADGGAIAEMLHVAAPAVGTMLSYTVMQFVDLLIVSHIGGDAIAAVGNAGVAAFLPAAAMFGVVGVINTFVSQNLGAGTPERGSSYAWNGLWLTVAVWAVVLIPFALCFAQVQALMRSVMGLEIADSIAHMEVQYGRILVFGMVLTIAARGLSHFFYGVHRPWMVMVAAVVGNAVNVPLTWALVTGAWGAPELGVAGAAIGTVIGSGVEFALLFAMFLSPGFNSAFKTRSAWRVSGKAMGDIWRIGWPAGLMFGNEILCWWVFMSGLIAHFGVVHNTAGFIVLRYMHVSFMPAVGLSMAVTAVVGKYIGRGRHDLAAKRIRLGLGIGLVYMGTCALAMNVFREPAIRLFATWLPIEDTSGADGFSVDELVSLGSGLLILAAAFQLFDALAIILTGALRGAGDTLFPGIVTVILSWVLIVGLGAVLKEQAPGLGSYGPWIGAASYIIVLSVVMLGRYWSGAWRRIDLLGAAASDVARGVRQPPLAVDAGEGVVPELPAIDLPTAVVAGDDGGGFEQGPSGP